MPYDRATILNSHWILRQSLRAGIFCLKARQTQDRYRGSRPIGHPQGGAPTQALFPLVPRLPPGNAGLPGSARLEEDDRQDACSTEEGGTWWPTGKMPVLLKTAVPVGRAVPAVCAPGRPSTCQRVHQAHPVEVKDHANGRGFRRSAGKLLQVINTLFRSQQV